MVQKSQATTWDGAKTPVNNWDKLSITLRIIGPSKAWRHFEDLNTPAENTGSGPLPLEGPSDP